MSRKTAEALRDGDLLDRAMLAAQRRVILHHRRMGVPLVVWREGQVVELDPETVELPDVEGFDDDF